MKEKTKAYWKELWRQIKNATWNYFHPFSKWRE